MNIGGVGSTGYAAASGANQSRGPAASNALSKTSAVDEFMKWASMTPAQRMRANMLASMGLTEEKVAAMSPEDRAKVEAKIKEMIEAKIKREPPKTGQLVDQKV